MHHKNKMDWCTDREIHRGIDMWYRKCSKMLMVESWWTVFRCSLKNSFKLFYVFKFFHNKMWGEKHEKKKSHLPTLGSLDSTHPPVCYGISTDVQMDAPSCCKGVIRAPVRNLAVSVKREHFYFVLCSSKDKMKHTLLSRYSCTVTWWSLNSAISSTLLQAEFYSLSVKFTFA